MRKKLLLFILAAFVCFTSRVTAYSSPGKPTGYISDFAGIISSATKQQLEILLTQVEATNSVQVAVVTITSLGGDTIENYAVKLFEDWKIGQKGKDNGILLLVAKEDRKLRIEVGYGLEGTLTDAQSGMIIRNIITPRFKENNYDQGIKDGVMAIASVLGGEPLVEPNRSATSASDAIERMTGIFFLGIFLLQWFVSILSRTKSWWLGGVIGGAAGVIFAGIWGLLGFGLIGLLIDYVVSKQYKQSTMTGSYPWWIGGKSGFGGGHSGGGGGFGGFGGGRSGGGGSSGSW